MLFCYPGILKRMCKVSLAAGKNKKIHDVLSTVCPLPLAHTSSAWRHVDVADILEHFDGHFFTATELAWGKWVDILLVLCRLVTKWWADWAVVNWMIDKWNSQFCSFILCLYVLYLNPTHHAAISYKVNNWNNGNSMQQQQSVLWLQPEIHYKEIVKHSSS